MHVGTCHVSIEQSRYAYPAVAIVQGSLHGRGCLRVEMSPHLPLHGRGIQSLWDHGGHGRGPLRRASTLVRRAHQPGVSDADAHQCSYDLPDYHAWMTLGVSGSALKTSARAELPAQCRDWVLLWQPWRWPLGRAPACALKLRHGAKSCTGGKCVQCVRFRDYAGFKICAAKPCTPPKSEASGMALVMSILKGCRALFRGSPDDLLTGAQCQLANHGTTNRTVGSPPAWLQTNIPFVSSHSAIARVAACGVKSASRPGRAERSRANCTACAPDFCSAAAFVLLSESWFVFQETQLCIPFASLLPSRSLMAARMRCLHASSKS